MKRTTILIYKDSTDPKKGLKEATQKEWSAILKSNKGLPMCKRRCFIEEEALQHHAAGLLRTFLKTKKDHYYIRHARKLGVDVLNGSEEVAGTPIENYIPEMRLAIETSDRLKSEAKVKGYICEKQGIRYIWVPLKRKDSLTVFAQRVKLALQKVHVYISTDEEEDVKLLRHLFEDWKAKG